MRSFKKFLEAAASATPEYKYVSLTDVVNDLKVHFKNAMWMIKDDRIIWRGDRTVSHLLKDNNVLMVDSSATERISENTSNYYTVILDNNPANAAYPKRSRSFICSDDNDNASDYGSPFVIIPFDSAKIGIVNSNDMWTVYMSVFGASKNKTIEIYNHSFHIINDLDNPTWQKFVNYDKKLKAGDPDALDAFSHFLKHINPLGLNVEEAVEKYKDKFLETLMEAYDYKKLGMTECSTATLPKQPINSEMWIGGKMLLMSVDSYRKMKRELLK